MAVAFFLTMQTLSRHKMFGLARHMASLKKSLKMDSDGAGEEKAEEEGEGEGEYTPGEADLMMAEGSAEETQVSGLANRTQHYLGPQGMQHPVGFGGMTDGSDVMY